MQARFRQTFGKADGTFPPDVKVFQDGIEQIPFRFFQDFLLTGMARNPVPLEVLVTWIAGDATEWVDSWDPETGLVRFKIPMGLFKGTSTFRKVMRDGADFLRQVSEEAEFKLLNPSFPPRSIPPAQHTLLACIFCEIMEIILDDDEEARKLVAKKIAELKELAGVSGSSQSDLAKSAQAEGGQLSLGVSKLSKGLDAGNPADFKGAIERFRARSPGFPLWQVAPLRHGNEIDADSAAGAKPLKKDGPNDLKVPQGGANSSDFSVPAGDGGVSLAAPFSVPAGESSAGVTGSTTVTGSTGQTVAETKTGPTSSKTVAEKLKDSKKRTAGAAGEMIPGPVLARVWVESRFEESAWPYMQFGDGPPALVDRVNAPWVEDIEGNVLTKQAFAQAAQDRWEQLNADSTVEESQEIEIGGIFKVGFGSVVRHAIMSWQEGGATPRVRVSCTVLGSRKLPFLRSAVVQERVGIGRR